VNEQDSTGLTDTGPVVTTASGIPVPVVATSGDVRDGLADRLGQPGEYPFTRGIRPQMYRSRPWTIRQLAGFGTARDTNRRYRMLLDQGATGVNGVFDYPSLRGFDSDDPGAGSDVGRGGVAVDVRDDFGELFDGIDLASVSVSLVSSQPIGAVSHFAMFLHTAADRGIRADALTGTSQNDFLMETAITIAPQALPPPASFRLECDLAEYTLQHVPRWNPVSVSGYNYREAGANAISEGALTLAHGQAIARELGRRGIDPLRYLPRISFFLDSHSDFFEEIAKFRALRRMWARWVRDELGVTDPAAQRFRFHTQTAGVTSTARHAHVNIARSMTQGLAAVLGGTQSLHVDGYDEAISIPTEHAARTALYSQLVLLHETGVARSADPLGGSYLVEYLTDAVEERVAALIATIDGMGGLVAATESGWVHRELASTAFADQSALETGEQLVVGINLEAEQEDAPVEPFRLPPGTLAEQCRRLAGVRARRDTEAWSEAIGELEKTALGSGNVIPAVLRAVEADATVGEIGAAFRRAAGPWEFPLW
jgi:methylmalonyl-CoA mutase N-terminal domain/subunit